MRARTGALAVLMMLAPGAATAAGPLWQQPSPASSPSVRCGQGMAYDELNSVAVVTEGLSGYSAGTVPSGTWAWDGGTWAQVSAGNPSPGRFGLSMSRSRTGLLAFGGATGPSTFLGDTNLFVIPSWAPQSPGTSPTGRSDACLAFDDNRQVAVLFGGRDATGNLADTWEWDGSAWLPVSNSGPPARAWHAMAYDSDRQLTLLFGGATSFTGPFFNDLWAWDGGAWGQLIPTTGIGPSPRMMAAFTYDSARKRAVLFGGQDTNPFGDTWEWDGTSWIQTADAGPSPRALARMVYDVTHQEVVLFGGADPISGNANNETWIYRGPAVVIDAGADAGLDAGSSPDSGSDAGADGGAIDGGGNGSGGVDGSVEDAGYRGPIAYRVGCDCATAPAGAWLWGLLLFAAIKVSATRRRRRSGAG